MFDQDDDEYQIKEEYDRCVKDEESKQPQGGMPFDESDYYGDQNDGETVDEQGVFARTAE